ncbi:MAG: hypothetical protein RI883_852 [Bacteroidota bacterium]|jgi:cell division protease FtsH
MLTGDSKKKNKNSLVFNQDKKPFPFYRIYLTIFIAIVLFYFFTNQSSITHEITWQEFNKEMLQNNDVLKIDIVNKETVEVFIKKESLKKDYYKKISNGFFGNINPGPHYFFQIGSVDVFERNLTEAQASFLEKDKIEIHYSSRNTNWWGIMLTWLIPFFLLSLLGYFLMRRMGGPAPGGMGKSIFDFGKSSPIVFEKGNHSPITFKDVAGYEEAKIEVMEIVEFLKHPINFTKLGAKIPKGILLEGAPGTGKTLMAKAVAGEAGVPFFSLSGSEFIEMFVGVGASRVRDLFNRAKEKSPSIVFIDEIDTIGRVRGKVLSIQSNDERESTLNQLLAEMDGFGPNTGIIVLAATNRADILDPALLRPGRFDRHIHLDLPNKHERLAIFNVHMKPLLIDKSVDREILASQTPGFSGADIANICNEAALIAARKKKAKIESQDFYDAIDRVISGLEKKSKIISLSERKIIAYHEAGHAIISWMLKNVDPLQKVSIIPRGKSLGGAWYLPEERQIITKAQFNDRLCAALGGRVAEEIIFNDVSSGALDDLEKVTKQAYMMVSQLGFSDKIGSISFYDSTGIYENSFQKPYSESTAKLIDDEVRNLVNQAKEKVQTILNTNISKLHEMATILLDKEVIYKEEIESILGKRILEEGVN